MSSCSRSEAEEERKASDLDQPEEASTQVSPIEDDEAGLEQPNHRRAHTENVAKDVEDLEDFEETKQPDHSHRPQITINVAIRRARKLVARNVCRTGYHFLHTRETKIFHSDSLADLI